MMQLLAVGFALLSALSSGTAPLSALVQTAQAPTSQRSPIGSRAQDAPIPPAELLEAIWVEGRVEFPAGTPADEHAFVVARGHRFSNDGYHRAEVARDGTFRVAFQKRTRGAQISLEARYSFLAEPVTFLKLSEHGPIVLQPQLGGCLHVELVPAKAMFARSNEFSGVDVSLELASDESGTGRVVRTGPDHTCDFGGLPPEGDGYVRVLAPRTVVDPQLAGGWRPGQVATMRVTVAAGVTLRGRVLDDAGQPIAGARLNACKEIGRYCGGYFEEKLPVSAADGSFEISGVPAGDWILDGKASRHLPAQQQLPDFADGVVADNLVLVLSRGETIAGSVTRPDGKPVAGALVSWKSMTGDHLLTLDLLGEDRDAVSSAADGTFAITGLEKGSLRVLVDAYPPGPQPKWRLTDPKSRREHRDNLWHSAPVILESGRSDVVLVVQAPLSITGIVVNAAGVPVRDFKVNAQQGFGGKGWSSADEVKGHMLDDGKFRVDGLYGGSWDVTVTADGFDPSMPMHCTLPAESNPLTIQLVRAASISGRVVAPDGTPVSGARVVVGTKTRLVHVLDTDEESAGGGLLNPGERLGGHSDDSGRFDLTNVSPGPVELSARAKGWADSEARTVTVEPGQHLADVVLTMRTGGRLVVDVLDAQGKPAPGWTLSLQTEDGDRSETATCDANGRAAVDGLRAGTWSLSAFAPDTDIMARFGKNVHWQTTDIKAGKTTTVTLRTQPEAHIHVSGIVRIGGKPAADVGIEAARYDDNPRFESSLATSGPDGRYELQLERAGKYAWTTKVGATELLSWVHVPEGPELAHDIDIAGGSIRGHVVGPDKKPLNGIDVTLVSDRASTDLDPSYTSCSTSSDASGGFEFTGLDVGSFRLEARSPELLSEGVHPELGRFVRDGLAIRTGTRLDVEIEMTKSCAVSGVVLDSTGSPARGVSVFARNASGVMLDREPLAHTDGAGRFQIDGLPAGSVTFFARGTTEASRESDPITLSDGTPGRADLRTESATRLYVETRDAAGAFLHRVQVRIFDERGRDVNAVSRDGVYDDDDVPGQLEALLPTGTWRIVARCEGGIAAEAHADLTGHPAFGVKLRLTN
jgi:5-hydroxyisourate hydrolase-like protein (transthyretin family)